MKFKKKFTKIDFLLGFFLSVLIILVSVKSVSVDTSFIVKKSSQYGNFDSLVAKGISKQNALTNVSFFVDYLKGQEDNLSVTFLNNKEVEHMKDVKNIFNFINYIVIFFMIISFILFIVFYKKNVLLIYKPYLLSFVFSFFLIILFVMFFIFFDSSFLMMHKILFSNNLWLMNPNQDFMILLFSHEFFKAILLRIIIYIVVLSVVFLSFGLLMLQQLKYYSKFLKKSN